MYGPLMYFGPLPDNNEEKNMDTPALTPTPDEHRAVLRLLEFSRILRAAGLLDDDQLDYFFEKPWKWDVEYGVWHSLGRPDLYGDAGAFDVFIEAAQKATAS